MLHVEWYHICWPRLTAKRVEPVVSISWASCLLQQDLTVWWQGQNTAILTSARSCKSCQTACELAAILQETEEEKDFGHPCYKWLEMKPLVPVSIGSYGGNASPGKGNNQKSCSKWWRGFLTAVWWHLDYCARLVTLFEDGYWFGDSPNTQSKHCKLVKGLEHEHKSYEKRLNFLCYHIVGVWRREELRSDLIQVYWIMHGLWWYRQIKLTLGFFRTG